MIPSLFVQKISHRDKKGVYEDSYEEMETFLEL